MDPRLLDYYNRELAHVREIGAEFAAEFPKVAARLGMSGIEVADPYVERLLEGFAFIAARVQLKIDAEYPRFTQHLLEMVYPHYLAPMPSFMIVECRPNFAEPALADGIRLPAGAMIRSVVPRGEQTACMFRVAHEVRLWPLELTAARYSGFAADLPLAGTQFASTARAHLRLRLRAHAGLKLKQIRCDQLAFYINAAAEVAGPLYELIHAQCLGVMVLSTTVPQRVIRVLPAAAVAQWGFADEQALLPIDRRSFHGYRLLREYFAFPQRFQFAALKDLAAAFAQIDANECELVLLFGRNEQQLEAQIDVNAFSLYATPVANVFERRADRIHLDEAQFEHHLVVDRGRPIDFEVFSVRAVRGIADEAASELEFDAFYGDGLQRRAGQARAYYTLRREPRLPSAKQKRSGTRTSYVGNEVFLSLVDEYEAPFRRGLKQLAIDVLATNRDLPLLLPIGARNTLTLEDALPVESLRVLAGPTRPKPSLVEGDFAWRLLSHLSLNYMSLLDAEPAGASASGARPPVLALRELLALYADMTDPALRKQAEAVVDLRAKPVTRRLPIAGPITFGRGLGIDLTLSEQPFGGAGGFLLGSVLEKFLARHVSLNSFTQTRLLSESRGEIAKCPARVGLRTIA